VFVSPHRRGREPARAAACTRGALASRTRRHARLRPAPRPRGSASVERLGRRDPCGGRRRRRRIRPEQARDGGRRGRRPAPANRLGAEPGRMPWRTAPSPITRSSAAIGSRSHSVSITPPPRQWTLDRRDDGESRGFELFDHLVPIAEEPLEADFALASPLTSTPVENARPLPHSTTARASGSSAIAATLAPHVLDHRLRRTRSAPPDVSFATTESSPVRSS